MAMHAMLVFKLCVFLLTLPEIYYIQFIPSFINHLGYDYVPSIIFEAFSGCSSQEIEGDVPKSCSCARARAFLSTKLRPPPTSHAAADISRPERAQAHLRVKIPVRPSRPSLCLSSRLVSSSEEDDDECHVIHLRLVPDDGDFDEMSARRISSAR